MGGTFDPIHHGHLVAASEVQGWFDLDEVVFVPTGQPWQKADRAVSPPEHRYLMTVIATAANPRFTVSRVDIDRGGPTYTGDTLRDLRRLRPDADLYFITGADALTDITFVEMKPAGTAVGAGGTVGEVESVKTSSEIYVPCAGTVSAVNDAAHKDPSLLNSDPYGKGWLVKLQGCDVSKLAGLMDAKTYDSKNAH